jgi:hypothetical protein
LQNNIFENCKQISVFASNHTITGNIIKNSMYGFEGGGDNFLFINNKNINAIHEVIGFCCWSNSSVSGNTVKNVWG